MTEECDDYESCNRICQQSIREGLFECSIVNNKTNANFFLLANSITNRLLQTSSIPWMILAVAILAILIIAIIVITIRYRRRTKNLTNTETASRM